MLTIEAFVGRLTAFLVRRDWCAAISWCEQGIVTLAGQPAPMDERDVSIAILHLPQDVVDLLEENGVTTICQLKEAISSGRDKLHFLPRIGQFDLVRTAIVDFESRNRGMVTHGQGPACPVRHQR